MLSLFDRQGTTLSSGHLPARRGDPDPELFAVTQQKSPKPVPVRVSVRGAEGLREVPALVTARPVDYGDLRLWAVGGVLLDEELAQHLARLTQAEVSLRSGRQRGGQGWERRCRPRWSACCRWARRPRCGWSSAARRRSRPSRE